MSVMSKRTASLRIFACAVALVVAAGFAVAQETRGDHPATYVVKKGDTLWDIAARFLKKPWLWPEIWQANPQVKNPHLIYPGDVLSLAYINRVGDQRQGPIPAIPLAQIEPFLKDMRIYDRIDNLPYVVALEDERLRGVRGQNAYVRGLAGAQPGTRYAILRPTQVYHMGRRRACCALVGRDDLGADGRMKMDPPYDRTWTEIMLAKDWGRMEKLGVEMRKVNAGVLTRGEVGGIEVSTLLLDDPSFEVRAGDKVVPVETFAYDAQFMPHPPRNQFKYGQAQVLSVADRNLWGGPRDVVALSVGARDGVDNGTVFSLWRVGNNVVDRIQQPERTADLVSNKDKVRLPDEFSGHVMVFRTFDKVSYGLVMESIKPSRVGYELKHPDATY